MGARVSSFSRLKNLKENPVVFGTARKPYEIINQEPKCSIDSLQKTLFRGTCSI